MSRGSIGAHEQGVDEVRQGHVFINVESQAHLALGGNDGAAHVDVARRNTEIGIGDDDTQKQERVRLLNGLGHRGVAGKPHIGTDEWRLAVGQEPTPHETRVRTH